MLNTGMSFLKTKTQIHQGPCIGEMSTEAGRLFASSYDDAEEAEIETNPKMAGFHLIRILPLNYPSF